MLLVYSLGAILRLLVKQPTLLQEEIVIQTCLGMWEVHLRNPEGLLMISKYLTKLKSYRWTEDQYETV